jgi:hypothetical protein
VVGLERLLVVMGVVRAWESRNYRDTAGVAGIQREAVEGKGLERGRVQTEACAATCMWIFPVDIRWICSQGQRILGL